MKILYLTTVLPSLKKTGGEIASQSFIDVLEQNGHEVVVVGYHRLGETDTRANEIAVGARCIETHKSYLYPLVWIFYSILKNLPYSVAKYYSVNYLKTLKSLIDKDKYDIIIIDHAQIGWLTKFLACSPIIQKSKVIFIAHNVEHEIYLDQCQGTQSWLSKYIYSRESHLIKTIEDKLASIADQVWTFTEHDSKYFYALNKNSIVFDLPPSSTPSYKPFQNQIYTKFDVGIIGSWTWKANLSGLKWFFQTVYPYLPKHLSIHVAGKGAEWLRDEYTNVEYCGFVPDAQAFMAESKVIAIPSIAGGGIQIKTLDAIASGSPIVATPTALRGILCYPSFVKVAFTPDEFAYTLVDLLEVSNFEEGTSHKLFNERSQWLQSRQQIFVTKVTNAINN